MGNNACATKRAPIAIADRLHVPRTEHKQSHRPALHQSHVMHRHTSPIPYQPVHESLTAPFRPQFSHLLSRLGGRPRIDFSIFTTTSPYLDLKGYLLFELHGSLHVGWSCVRSTDCALSTLLTVQAHKDKSFRRGSVSRSSKH